MSVPKTADQWFAEYDENHQHRANLLLHGSCAPVIFGCVLGFIWTLPVPEAWQEAVPWFNWMLVAIAATTILYVRLSPALGAGMFFFMAVCYAVIVLLDLFAPWSVGSICVVAFMVAWIGQVVGHILERRIPSFSKDVVFILIGPAWLVSRMYRKIGQKY